MGCRNCHRDSLDRLCGIRDPYVHNATTMSDTKTPANNDSAGQNPFWPGEGAQPAGEIIDEKRDEKTTIPLVDSLPHKPNTTT